jgi:hypothetical protein
MKLCPTTQAGANRGESSGDEAPKGEHMCEKGMRCLLRVGHELLKGTASWGRKVTSHWQHRDEFLSFLTLPAVTRVQVLTVSHLDTASAY